MAEHDSERGTVVAFAVVASALALFGYSLGYQNGHMAGLKRMALQLDMLAKRQAELPADVLDCGAAEAAADTNP